VYIRSELGKKKYEISAQMAKFPFKRILHIDTQFKKHVKNITEMIFFHPTKLLTPPPLLLYNLITVKELTP